MKYIFLFLLFSFAPFYSSATSYDYSKLMFKDYEDMKKTMDNYLWQSRKFTYPAQAEQAVSPLRNALKFVYSRPDNDNVAGKVAYEIINDLKTMDELANTIGKLFDEAKSEIKSPDLSPKQKTTALIMMNNMILDMKPEMLTLKSVAKQICKIADEEIKVPIEVTKDTSLYTLINNRSPSELASRVMIWYGKRKGTYTEAKANLLLKNITGCPFSSKNKKS